MAEVESINGNPIVAEVASESIQPSVDAWLAAHPEATTTVQNGAISTAKLADGAVTDAKLAQTGGLLELSGGIFTDDLGICYKQFHHTAGHSSNSDLCDAPFQKGDTAKFIVETSSGESLSGTVFFKDSGGTNVQSTTFTTNTYKEINLGFDTAKMGAYLPAPSTPCDVTIKVYKAASVGTMLARFDKTGKESIAPLILGGGDTPVPVVAIDSVAKTITFPTDTIIINNTYYGNNYYILAASSGSLTCDFSQVGSTAVKIYYDPATSKLVPAAYGTVNERMILICTLRAAGYTAGTKANISVPYTIDGMLFGRDLNEYVDTVHDYIVKGINHRGYNIDAPENTIPAFKLSKQHGFKYVETDIAFTSDNVAVLLHDSTVDRTSNGTGNISQLTYEYVSGLDFGSWKSSAYAGTKIPTLDEFLTLCRNLGLHPYLELKASGAYTQAQIQSVVDAVRSHGMKGNVTYISFDNTYLEWVRSRDSKARLGYLSNYGIAEDIQAAVALRNDANDVFIGVMVSSVNSTVISSCIANDLPLEVWVTSTVSQIQTLDPYITGVTSDQVVAGAVLYNYAK